MNILKFHHVIEPGFNSYCIETTEGNNMVFYAWDMDDLSEQWMDAYGSCPGCIKNVTRVPDSPWLAKRKEELSLLKFKYTMIPDLSQNSVKALEQAGFFCYPLRDWDEGIGFNIEVSAVINRIGWWVTDMDLRPYMNDGQWIGIDELSLAELDWLCDEDVESYL